MIKIAIAIILAALAYPYYCYLSYQKGLINFRHHLKNGARVKFLHHKKPLLGNIKCLLPNGRVLVKEDSGMTYFTTKSNIYPMLGQNKPKTKKK